MRAIKLSKHFRPLLGIFCVVHTLQRRPKITKMSYHCECASCGVTLSQYPNIQPRANKCPNVFLVLSCKFSNNFWVTIPFSFHYGEMVIYCFYWEIVNDSHFPPQTNSGPKSGKNPTNLQPTAMCLLCIKSSSRSFSSCFVKRAICIFLAPVLALVTEQSRRKEGRVDRSIPRMEKRSNYLPPG